ncbi:hypothetical protein CAEBREN_13451 [Caenorhabditis brenneri]|uniref:polynucleotide adenylyltransferase n=1 Tax=Caenorhabditis brenneri TaxID=135651 RepID=G0NS80_CAEBE|nr:hypothetical protein CAEBREN_13451 [Caenorhabditis brenneri]
MGSERRSREPLRSAAAKERSFNGVSGLYLVGGAASHVAVKEYKYADLDVLLSIASDPSLTEDWEKKIFGLIRQAIYEVLRKSALIDKRVLVLNPNTESNEAWSLSSIYNKDGRNLELKSVMRMARKYQFATDSLTIDLVPLMDQIEGEVVMYSTSMKSQGSAWNMMRGRAILDSFLKNHFSPTDLNGKRGCLRMLALFLQLMEKDVKRKRDGKTGKDAVWTGPRRDWTHPK